MTTLVYNNIILDVLETQDYLKETVYEGPDYLYTRHTITVEAIYNPSRVAYTEAPGVAGTEPGTVNINPLRANLQLAQEQTALSLAGASVLGSLNVPLATIPGAIGILANSYPAPMTDRAIRHQLLIPRRTLNYTCSVVGGAQTVLMVAANDSLIATSFAAISGLQPQTDSKNGPTPLACDVVEIAGTKTFRVIYTVQVHLNECPKFIGSRSARLLTNRYTQTLGVDVDMYSTLVTQGRAIFDTNLMLRDGNIPDDLREYLLPQCPLNFRRQDITIIAIMDGTGLEYTVTDREVACNLLVRQNVTRIEGEYSEAVASAGNEAIVGGAIAGFTAGLGGGQLLRETVPEAPDNRMTPQQYRNRLQAIRSAIAHNRVVSGVAAVSGAIGGAIRSGGIPVRTQSIKVTVYGNRLAKRRDLETIGLLVIRARFLRLMEIADLQRPNNPAFVGPLPQNAPPPNIFRDYWNQVTNELAILVSRVNVFQTTGQTRAFIANRRAETNQIVQRLAGFTYVVTEDLIEKTVTIQGSRTSSVQESFINAVSGNSIPFVTMPTDDLNGITTTSTGPTTPFFSGGSTGTWIGRVEAADLGVPCRAPSGGTTPRTPGNVVNPLPTPQPRPDRPDPQPLPDRPQPREIPDPRIPPDPNLQRFDPQPQEQFNDQIVPPPDPPPFSGPIPTFIGR